MIICLPLSALTWVALERTVATFLCLLLLHELLKTLILASICLKAKIRQINICKKCQKQVELNIYIKKLFDYLYKVLDNCLSNCGFTINTFSFHYP